MCPDNLSLQEPDAGKAAGETSPVVRFDEPRCAEHAVAGGKGANLARLTAAGFDVPGGFVVTTAAYDGHIAPLQRELIASLEGLAADDVPALEATAAQVRERIEAAPVPEDLVATIAAAYAELGGGYVAVRSSGTAEDLEGAAFAGLHDTLLDIRGKDELLAALRQVWASVWTSRAIAYRRKRGFTDLPSIAVVVQVMVESEVAGVLFTANPLNRVATQMLVNANWGLGESVVGGITGTDQFVLTHEGHAVVEVTIGDKQVEVVRNPETGRGAIERPVEEERRERRTLDDRQLADLARAGQAVQEHYGTPQDIEWALADGRLWLLQSRPITGVTFDGRTLQVDVSPVHHPGRALRWTTANVDEGLPGVLTPLTWSMYFPPTESTMRDCWVDLGVFREQDRPVPSDVDGRFFSSAYGHAIANVDLMGQLAARVPGGSAAQMEEQLFGSVQGGGPPPPRGLEKVARWPFVLAKLPVALRRAMRALDPLAADVVAWWERTAFALDDASHAEALAALVEARNRFEDVLRVHMVLAIASQGVLGQVETLAARAGLPGLERELIRSEKGTAEFELVRDLWRLSRDEIGIDAFLRSHGYHGPREGLVESVVWREDPTPVLQLAKAYAERAGAEDVDATAARRHTEQVQALARLQAALPRPARRPAAGLVRFAAHVPDWRETGRACILRCVDVARAASRALGRSLVEDGCLTEPSDVDFLTLEELVADDRASFTELVAQRRVDHAAYETMSLPHVWHGLPPVDATDAPAAEGVARLDGLGVSAGTATGTVRVIRDLSDADIPEGTVMVCKATDPSWASLFPLASAVVTDVGSALSHAAIVCRELGLPCVANTRTGTRDLQDGMRVCVDGSAGTVEILDAAL